MNISDKVSQLSNTLPYNSKPRRSSTCPYLHNKKKNLQLSNWITPLQGGKIN